MPDTVFGVPIHPLVVHAVVVLLPLAALGAIALAAVPRWRGVYGWLVLAAATIATASVPMATRSGNALAETLQLGGPVADKVEQHSSLGEKVIFAALPMWALLLAVVLMHRAGRRGPLMTALWVLAAVAGVVAIGLTVRTGHLGSQAVWDPGG